MTPPSPRLTLIAALDQQRGIGVAVECQSQRLVHQVRDQRGQSRQPIINGVPTRQPALREIQGCPGECDVSGRQHGGRESGIRRQGSGGRGQEAGISQAKPLSAISQAKPLSAISQA